MTHGAFTIQDNTRRCLLPGWGVKSNGNHFTFLTTCKSYTCDRCGHAKLIEKVQVLAHAIHDLEVIQEVAVVKQYADTVSRAITNKKLSSFRIKFRSGGLLVYTDTPAKGQAWRTTGTSYESVINKTSCIDPKTIKRIEATKDWREEKMRQDREPLTYHKIFSSYASMQDKLGRVGIDPAQNHEPIDITNIETISQELSMEDIEGPEGFYHMGMIE